MGARHKRAGRLISLPSPSWSEGTDMRLGCQRVGSMLRALGGQLGGLQKFVPCTLGVHDRRPRHSRWERCGHGSTSRLKHSGGPEALNALLRLFLASEGLMNGVAHCHSATAQLIQQKTFSPLVLSQSAGVHILVCDRGRGSAPSTIQVCRECSRYGETRPVPGESLPTPQRGKG